MRLRATAPTPTRARPTRARLEGSGTRWKITSIEPFSVSVPVGAKPLNWPEIFGNSNRVEIEVGFGKGMFLIAEGVRNPGTNYFGVEIVRKYQLYATTRIAVRKLPNVRTCCADARLVLRDFVTPESVDTVHVFFPDPWWKNKHKKRLLFTPEFAELVHRVLKPQGVLHFVTDVQDYFEMVDAMLKADPSFTVLTPPDASAAAHDLDYLTNFERKYRLEGRSIYRAHYRLGAATA